MKEEHETDCYAPTAFVYVDGNSDNRDGKQGSAALIKTLTALRAAYNCFPLSRFRTEAHLATLSLLLPPFVYCSFLLISLHL